jgi:hypothetical protein
VRIAKPPVSLPLCSSQPTNLKLISTCRNKHFLAPWNDISSRNCILDSHLQQHDRAYIASGSGSRAPASPFSTFNPCLEIKTHCHSDWRRYLMQCWNPRITYLLARNDIRISDLKMDCTISSKRSIPKQSSKARTSLTYLSSHHQSQHPYFTHL